MKWIFKILFSKKAKRQCAINNIDVICYDPTLTGYDEPNIDENAKKCYKGLDDAHFSMSRTNFDYFLNGLQNKVNVYRKLNKN